ANGIAERSVLVFWVDHQEIDANEEIAQRHELREVAFSGAGCSEDDGVGVLQAWIEGIKEDRRMVVVRDPVEHAALHREGARGEREGRGKGAGVQVSIEKE